MILTRILVLFAILGKQTYFCGRLLLVRQLLNTAKK